MCGIIGYIGEDNGINDIKESLKKLEYRGYDSSGIGYLDNNQFNIIKESGTVDNLINIIDNNYIINSNLLIAHTRWATHGNPNKINSHPHMSNNNKIIIIHNGIVENYLELKNKYLSNYTFDSETDTEIISNLIEFFILKEKDFLKVLKNILSLIKGQNSFLILNLEEKDKIYFIKKNAPLIIGTLNNKNYISSDVNAIINFTNSIIYLDDISYGYIKTNDIKVFNKYSNKINYDIKYINKEEFNNELSIYKHYMIKEIYEIKSSLINTLNYYLDSYNNVIKIDSYIFKDIKSITIIGCGTSYHSGLIGKKLLEDLTDLEVDVEIASEFFYNKKINTCNKNKLYILISQSGETLDTILCARKIKDHNNKILAITNGINSTLTTLVDNTIYLKCGVEISVASTKAYNTQILIFYLIISIIRKDSNIINNLKNLIDNLNIEYYDNLIKNNISKYYFFNKIFIIGKHYDYIQSLEAALKIKEVTYIHSEGYPSGELKHGTLALIDEDSLVICISTDNKLKNKIINSIKEVEARKAKTLIISNLDYNYDQIKLLNYDSIYLPLISIIPMQLFAYYLSIFKNINPDKPRNLAKSVTVE